MSKNGLMNCASISGRTFVSMNATCSRQWLSSTFAADAELFRDESHRGDAAALAVAAVVHLARRFIDMPARHRLAAAETDHPATTFLRGYRNAPSLLYQSHLVFTSIHN